MHFFVWAAHLLEPHVNLPRLTLTFLHMDKDDLYRPRIRAWKGSSLQLLPFQSWKSKAYLPLLQIIAHRLLGSSNVSIQVTAKRSKTHK